MHDLPEGFIQMNQIQPYEFAYSISMWMDDTGPAEGVQLTSRRWIISEPGAQDQVVDGEGVVGMFPILRRNDPPPDRPFRYASKTRVTHLGEATMGGLLRFVRGTRDAPLGGGQELEVEVPTWRMGIPAMLF